jgi:hypothetical protein
LVVVQRLPQGAYAAWQQNDAVDVRVLPVVVTVV